MSVIIYNDELKNEAIKNGVLIGKSSPSRETQFYWWQVYLYNDRIFACVFPNTDTVEEISPDEVSAYVDDVEEANRFLGISAAINMGKTWTTAELLRMIEGEKLDRGGDEYDKGWNAALDEIAETVKK